MYFTPPNEQIVPPESWGYVPIPFDGNAVGFGVRGDIQRIEGLPNLQYDSKEWSPEYEHA